MSSGATYAILAAVFAITSAVSSFVAAVNTWYRAELEHMARPAPEYLLVLARYASAAAVDEPAAAPPGDPCPGEAECCDTPPGFEPLAGLFSDWDETCSGDELPVLASGHI